VSYACCSIIVQDHIIKAIKLVLLQEVAQNEGRLLPCSSPIPQNSRHHTGVKTISSNAQSEAEIGYSGAVVGGFWVLVPGTAGDIFPSLQYNHPEQGNPLLPHHGHHLFHCRNHRTNFMNDEVSLKEAHLQSIVIKGSYLDRQISLLFWNLPPPNQ
jgi:hypothetical protein